MKNQTKNTHISVLAKLKNKSDSTSRNFNEILQYYGMERFLYRLSKTRYAGDFILKGGLMLHGLRIPRRRITKDIDFLNNRMNAQTNILPVFHEAMSVESLQDGVLFDKNSLRVSQNLADHSGVRVNFVAYLGKTRIPIQVDVGYLDEIFSEPVVVEYPVILEGMDQPLLKGYPPESIISEKFYAMIRFADANSRFKDYYDIYLLSKTFDFDGHSLANAIKSTFAGRMTRITNQIPHGLRNEFAISNQSKWEVFLGKEGLQNTAMSDLMVIIHAIWEFLEYPTQLAVSHASENIKRWNPNDGWK